MTKKLEMWIFIKEEKPKISSIHMLLDQLIISGINEEKIQLGLIFNERQYLHFYSLLTEMFTLPKSDPLLAGFAGFKIKIIKEQQCSEK